MNDIVIKIYTQTGFGDQYASLITGYNALIDLKSMGFNPTIIISKGHKYFPQNVDLSVIYNLDSFKYDDITQINCEDEDKIVDGYELLLFTSIQIWVRKKTDKLIEYYNYHKFISRHNHSLFGVEPNLDFNIYNDDIMKQSQSFVNGKKNLIGIHFRGGDNLLVANIQTVLNDEYWGNEIKRAEKLISDNSNSDIMICSINKSISNYFSEKYKNVFSNDFKNTNLPMHNIVDRNDRGQDFNDYINHSKEILSEMISLSYCGKIVSYNHFKSNFILYGLVNNQTVDNWIDKPSLLIY